MRRITGRKKEFVTDKFSSSLHIVLFGEIVKALILFCLFLLSCELTTESQLPEHVGEYSVTEFYAKGGNFPAIDFKLNGAILDIHLKEDDRFSGTYSLSSSSEKQYFSGTYVKKDERITFETSDAIFIKDLDWKYENKTLTYIKYEQIGFGIRETKCVLSK